MASEVSICNDALGNVGKPDIADLNEQSAEARACKKYYSKVRDVLLAQYPWSFAGKKVALAEVTNDRAKQWAHAFRKPADCLTVRLLDDECGAYSTKEALERGGLPYAISETTIYCDIAPVWLEYTFRLTDPTRFSALFVEAMGWHLAVRIALPLTQNASLRADAFKLAGAAASAAAVADANQERVTSDAPAEAVLTRREYGPGVSH